MSLYKITVIGIETPFQVEAATETEALEKVLKDNGLINVEGDIELIG